MQIIIIGSGLGGLSAGAMLACNGHKVTILEQAHQAGGCLQCFERNGVRFETGMHIVGSVGEGEILSNYLKLFGVDGKLKFSRLDSDSYDIVSLGGCQYDFANGHEEMIDSMMRHFPREKGNLREYWRLVDSVAHSAPHYGMGDKDSLSKSDILSHDLFQRSLNSVIEQVVEDPILRQVLVGNIPLYAAVKDRTPFSTHAFVADFYNKGSYRIVGGSDNLARALRDVIESNGGTISVGKRVTEVRCNWGRVVSVVSSDGSEYDGDIFISDIHPSNLVSLFSPYVLRTSYAERVVALPNTTAVFSLFLHFKDDCVPYLNSNYFCYRGMTTPWTLGHCAMNLWPDGYLYMHHCHADGAKYAKSGVMLSYMPFDWVRSWENTQQGRRGADYEQFKRQCAEKMLDALDESFPGIKSCIREYYTATPLSYRDYTLTPEGSMYGVLRDVNSGVTGRVSWRTKLPNLMLVGQNINAHGILGVLIGSLQVCESINNDTMVRGQDLKLQWSFGCPQNNQNHVVVIGGGLGGLLTAAFLAKNGRKVTIVEKNKSIGGGLQMFRRGNVEFATGMHVFGGFVKGGVMDRICRYLGINDKVGITDTDADCIDEILLNDGYRYVLPRGRENYERYLVSLFPHESHGIKAYLDAIYALANAELSMWEGASSTLVLENPQFLMAADLFIASYIKDVKLRGLLSYLAPLYAGVSGETPAYEHAMVNVLHIEGSSMFANGSQPMADALASIVTAAGGRIMTGEEVVRVDVVDHRAVAVVTATGSRINAEQVVSDIDPRRLMQIVTPGAFPASFRDRINDAPYGYSAFKLFLKLKDGAVPHVSHPKYFYNGLDSSGVWDADKVSIDDWPRCAMAVTSRGVGDAASTMTVVAPISFDWFDQWGMSSVGHRQKEYYLFKEKLEQKLLAVLRNAIPELADNVVDCFSSTPLTIRDYNGMTKGSMYGFHKDCNHIMYTQLSVNTKVRNLFLTGQCVNLHGMCGVAITSVMTAEAILGRGALMCRL